MITIPKTRKYYDSIVRHIINEETKKTTVPLMTGDVSLVVDKTTRKVYNVQSLSTFVMPPDLEFFAEKIDLIGPSFDQLKAIRTFKTEGGNTFWDDEKQTIVNYKIKLTPIDFDYFSKETYTYVFIGKQDIKIKIEIVDNDENYLPMGTFSDIFIKNKGMVGVPNNLLINGENDLKVGIPAENPQYIDVHIGDLHEECIIKFKCKTTEWIDAQISIMATD